MLKWTKFYRRGKGATEAGEEANNTSKDNNNSVESPSLNNLTENPSGRSLDRLSDQDSQGVDLEEAGTFLNVDSSFGDDISPEETHLQTETSGSPPAGKHQTKDTAFRDSSFSSTTTDINVSAVSVTTPSASGVTSPSTPEDKTESLQASASSPTVLTSSPKQPRQIKMASALPDVTKLVPGMDREALGPEVEWEEEDTTMAQVAELDEFPCIGYFEEKVQEKDGQWHFLSAGLKIYSRQPVLLQMRSKKKQARARTIIKDPDGAFYEVGQTLIIPDDYKGWFEVMPSDFSRATCYTSIAELAHNMPRKFFTRSNVKGIRIEGEGENQKYLERKVPAGSVLETRGTFSAKWKTVAETGTFKKKTKEFEMQEVTYLKCIDHDQMELLVPLSHRGKFNAIYERGHLTQNAVYSMKDILSDLSLPVKVRLLFGKAPVVPCIFTGMLVVRSAAVDDAVVGSTILNKRNVLFEIPATAPVKVKYQTSDAAFEEMASYKDAQKLCKKYAKMYSTMIKLSPDMDTDQKVIQHVPSDPSVMRKADEAIRSLDLITDISLTGEPKDHLLDSDSGSMGSEEQEVIPKGGTLSELTEYKCRESQTHV